MKVPLLEDSESIAGAKCADDRELGHRIAGGVTPAESRHRAHTLFKVYMVGSMVFFWTGYTLLVRYTRTTVPPSEMYASSTTILMTEVLKFLVTIFFLFQDVNFSGEKFVVMLNDEFLSKPWELLKMSVPSVAYALQNNLDFVSLSNLDAGVYQVMIQLKIVTTALFMMLILRRSFSLRRWVAIVLLFAGVAFVQLSKLQSAADQIVGVGIRDELSAITAAPRLAGGAGQNPAVGMIAVLCTCATAGFAGVYFEMMLKDGSTTPFWIRNLQMYVCGLVSTCIGCALYDSELIAGRGFFYGYNTFVWLIIVFLGLGGIFISLIMKYMDNLYKSFASSVSIIFVVLMSAFLFDDTKLNGNFLIGSAAVCVALILYNSVND